MVVSISHNGYIKRTPASVYRAQRRGGKGIKGAKTDEEDPVEHLFVASTHDYLLFFTNKGKVYWQKVYDLPQLSRESKGRAVVNLLNLAEDEKIADCRAVRDFDQPDHYLMMATRKGLVKKTDAEGVQPAAEERHHRHQAQGRTTSWSTWPSPSRATRSCSSTASGMAIRFSEADARPMGRNTSGVKGIKLRKGDDARRHGRRRSRRDAAHRLRERLRQAHAVRPERRSRRESPTTRTGEAEVSATDAADAGADEAEEDRRRSVVAVRYRTQSRGGKGSATSRPPTATAR